MPAFIVLFGLLSFLPAALAELAIEKPVVPIQWYTGGAEQIQLQPVAANSEYRLDLAGSTHLRTLMVKLAREDGNSRQMSLPVDAQGRFKAGILVKDGPGNYTVTLLGSTQAGALSFAGLGRFDVRITGTVPADLPGLALNDKVLAYVDSVMGRTVGRGECWDLAQEALDRNGADWTRPLAFGKVLDPARDEIRPGDIIQFRSLRTEIRFPNGGWQSEALGEPDHTAVIRAVRGAKRFQLAHQNLGGKRFVQLTELDLNHQVSGRFWIYRPVAGLILSPL